MLLVLGAIVWAVVAFIILHDNASTRRDIKAFSGQFNGNMQSFFSRMLEMEKSLDEAKKGTAELARMAGLEDQKLEQKLFFELGELREAQANLVDNMSSRLFEMNTSIMSFQNAPAALKKAVKNVRKGSKVTKKGSLNGRSYSSRSRA